MCHIAGCRLRIGWRIAWNSLLLAIKVVLLINIKNANTKLELVQSLVVMGSIFSIFVTSYVPFLGSVCLVINSG